MILLMVILCIIIAYKKRCMLILLKSSETKGLYPILHLYMLTNKRHYKRLTFHRILIIETTTLCVKFNDIDRRICTFEDHKYQYVYSIGRETQMIMIQISSIYKRQL